MTDPLPDWVTAIPSADVHNLPTGQGSELTNPFTQQQLLELGAQLIEQFLQKVLLAIVGTFIPGVSSFDQLRDWALTVPGITQLLQVIKDLSGVDLLTVFQGIDITDPGAVLTAIEQAIANIVNGIIQAIIDAVTGAVTGSTAQGNDVTAIIQALALPLQLAANIPNIIAALVSTVQADVAALTGQAQVNAANIAALQAAGVVTLPAGKDTFNRTTGIGADWTNVVGTLAISNNMIQTLSLSAGYYSYVPLTDRHAATIRIDNKLEGVARAFICSDTGMTNYAAVEVFVGMFGNDYLRIVTGSAPNIVVSHAQVDFPGYQLYNASAIEIRYDPVANLYRVLKDGQDIGLSWEDTTNIVTHVSKRRSGIVSNGTDHGYPYCGPGITEFAVRDW